MAHDHWPIHLVLGDSVILAPEVSESFISSQSVFYNSQLNSQECAACYTWVARSWAPQELLLLYFILANSFHAPLSPHSDVLLPAWTFSPRYLSSHRSPHIDSPVLPWLNTSVLLFTARLLLCNSYTYSRISTQNNMLSQNSRMGDKWNQFFLSESRRSHSYKFFFQFHQFIDKQFSVELSHALVGMNVTFSFSVHQCMGIYADSIS